jgi:hypothetical protein
MKESSLNIRIHTDRLNKLRLVAKDRKKSMTQLVQDWIDKLKLKPAQKKSEEKSPMTVKGKGI